MIWILLYPFRGTTEPPRLSQNSRIRKAFYRYGAFTAKRWLKTLLLFSIVAVFLAYTASVQYLGPSLDHLHVPYRTWSSISIHHDDNASITPDLELRQVWVHGDYGSALSKEVLLASLEIERVLAHTSSSPSDLETNPFAPTDVDHCGHYADPANSWRITSPTILWNCSSGAIASDEHLELKTRLEELDSGLIPNPSLLFAGVGVNPSKIERSDALVISVFDTDPVNSGTRWPSKLRSLEQVLGDKVTFYPSSDSTHSHLLYYQTKPTSIRDHILLGFAYGSMALYVTIFMYYQRALRSRFGLLFAVITEVTFSALASIAICNYIGINLGELPQEAYPFIVFVLGLDNVFRLINTLFSLPPQSSAVVRIANALGDVGYLSLITALQNLLVLWVMSRIVTPSVAAFCAYAAIALVFDVAFQLTFLVAVISVDIRRIELEDSLNKILAKRQALSSGTKVSWVLELFKNNFQFHSRIAATSVVVSFIIMVDSHFMDRRLGCWFGLCRSSFLSQTITSKLTELSTTPASVNRVDSLHRWVMKLRFSQLYRTFYKGEFGDNGILTRVYDPIIAVLNNSDRSIPRAEQISFITVPLEIVRNHFIPFSCTLIVTMILLTLLMNFLLWNDSSDDDLAGDPMHNMLLIQAGTQCHTLDIEALYSSRKGHFISLSLDRSVYIYIYNNSSGHFCPVRFPTSLGQTSLWPLKSMAIDDSGSWVAAYTSGGCIFIWETQTRRFQRRIDVFSDHTRAPDMAIFQFVSTRSGDKNIISLVFLTNLGLICQVDVDTPVNNPPVPLTSAPISSSNLIVIPNGELRLSFSTSDGKFGTFSKTIKGDWEPSFSRYSPSPSSLSLLGIPTLKLPPVILTSLSLVAGVDANGRAISLCSLSDSREIYSIPLHDETAVPSSLRVLHSAPRACPYCYGMAVHALSVVYNLFPSSECVMHTFTSRLRDDQDLMCLGISFPGHSSNGTPPSTLKRRGKGDSGCHTLENAARSTHRVTGSGIWEATRSHSIIGIRRGKTPEQQSLLNGSRRSSLLSSSVIHPLSVPLSLTSSMQSKSRLRLSNRRKSAVDSIISVGSTSEQSSKPAFNSSFFSVRRRSRRCAGTSTNSNYIANSRSSSSSSSSPASAPFGPWEIFSLSSTGEFSCEPLIDPNDPVSFLPNELFRATAPLLEELPFVSNVSCLTPIGERSVAIGFGSRVWVVTLGPSERFDGSLFGSPEGGRLDGVVGGSIAGRRNRGSRKST